MTIARLAAALGGQWPDHDPNSLAYAVRYLVPLVQVPPRGVWGGATMQPTVTTLRSWLGRPAPVAPDVDDLVVRYLRAFGPASTADIRAWSWLTDVRVVVTRLRPQLRVYRDEAGRELYDVCNGLFCDPSAAAPVRFLPQYDNVFLAHADRGRIMDEVRWGSSFTHRGSLFVGGFLSGAWRLTSTKRQSTLTVELRRRVRRIESREVRSEAGELLSFLTPDARSRRLALESGY
jgi:DNA glycosylase AlkZ-like